jgi:hypothetical protein
MKTIAEISKETVAIESFLKTCKPGEKIPYLVLEKETNVKMDTRGKAFLRSAMRRLRLEYSCIRGHGIELCSPKNATSIIAYKIIGVDRSVRRAHKTTRHVSDQFYHQLADDDKRQVAIAQSILSPIMTYAKGARMLFAKPVHKAIN